MPLRFISRSRANDPDHIPIRHQGEVFKVMVARRTTARRYSLRVSPATGDVVLTLPPRGDLDRAARFAASHGGWIAARVKRLPERVPFAVGSVIPLRGVEHRIVHRQALRGGVSTDVDGRGQAVLIAVCDAPHLARRIHDFLVAEARRDLERAARRYARTLGLSFAKLTLRDTVSRWGSCSVKGHLSFSWRLIFAPDFVLDYLAAHEIAHLKEMNHSPRYWRIVAGLCPHWKDAERWLKRHGSELHRYG
jgi:hypothetical protein